MSADKPRRLGRGLEALLAQRPASAKDSAKSSADHAGAPAGGARTAAAEAPERSALRRVAIADIRANPYQPRKNFAPEELTDLEASLRVSGLLQPITVRTAPDGKGYELIAGERRFRAASRLGWTDIPAVVKEIDDQTLLTLALVENLQRSDLNPLEQAEGYQRLIEQFSLTQQQVADVVGKDRSTVANILRLLHLPQLVRRMLQEGQLSLGHARALLAVGNEQRMIELARETVAKGLTVRDIEERARNSSDRGKTRESRAVATAGAPKSNAESKRITELLRRHLQTDVKIALSGDERGTIEIAFYSAEDLERLLEAMVGQKRERM